MDTKWKLGDQTPFGVIVEKPFMGKAELLPEHVYHYPDPESGPVLNQFCYVNSDEPWATQFWCTQNGSWDGPRKLRTGKFVADAPYPEWVMLETNYDPSDQTFGEVGALVVALSSGEKFIAVNEHSRRRYSGSDGIMEAKRHRHGSTDVVPTLASAEEYNMGVLLINSAWLHGAKNEDENTLARIRAKFTIKRGLIELPDLPAPFTWVSLTDFAYVSMDILTQGVLWRASERGYLK